MGLPSTSHSSWGKLIKGENRCSLKFLATKILLGRLQLKYRRESIDPVMQACVSELRTFMEKHAHLPAVKSDIAEIFK